MLFAADVDSVFIHVLQDIGGFVVIDFRRRLVVTERGGYTCDDRPDTVAEEPHDSKSRNRDNDDDDDVLDDRLSFSSVSTEFHCFYSLQLLLKSP